MDHPGSTKYRSCYQCDEFFPRDCIIYDSGEERGAMEDGNSSTWLSLLKRPLQHPNITLAELQAEVEDMDAL